MSEWTMQSDVGDPQILSRRLGAFLKAQGPTKEIARRIAADERTVENIRAGRTWPIARHWLRIWFEFGDDVLEAVFYPERVEARLAREAIAREQARQQRIGSASRVAIEKAWACLTGGPGSPVTPSTSRSSRLLPRSSSVSRDAPD